MVSKQKRERRRQQKILAQLEYLREVKTEKLFIRELELMVEEMKFQRRMRKKTLQMAKRRNPGAYIK